MINKSKEILEQDYPKLIITEKTIDAIMQHPKFFRGHIRTLMGKLYNSEEFEKKSDSILKQKMP